MVATPPAARCCPSVVDEHEPGGGEGAPKRQTRGLSELFVMLGLTKRRLGGQITPQTDPTRGEGQGLAGAIGKGSGTALATGGQGEQGREDVFAGAWYGRSRRLGDQGGRAPRAAALSSFEIRPA